MNQKTYHINPTKLAESEAFTPKMYQESFLKAVWHRVRKPSGKTILKPLPATDFAVLRAAQLTLSHGYRYFGITNEAAGYAITNANAYAIRNMAFGDGHTTYVPSLSIPIFKPESELMIRCFNERPEGGFALDAQFISHSIRTKYDPRTS
jgi:hypothetical protein